MRFVSLGVFVVLQLAFLPLALIGLVLVGYRQMVVSRRLGVSQTAIEVLNGRWTLAVFGLREDEASVRLAKALPNTSVFGLWLCLAPLWVKQRIDGRPWLYPRIPPAGTEGIADLVTARTVHFDRALERSLPEVEQFVVLGAGFDARAYGPGRRSGLEVFEVDQARTQELKVASLKRAGIDASHVHFVPVDFSQQRLFDELAAAGYDSSRPSLFLWEGVTLYLAEEDVRRTLADIREHSPAGSVVVADLYGERFVERGRRGSKGGKALQYTGEQLDFGLDFEREHEAVLAGFLSSEGYTVREASFLGTSNARGPFMVVADFAH